MSTQPDHQSTKTCHAEIRSGSVWNRLISRCGRRAKIERNGQWFCGIHDPAKRDAARKRADEAFDARVAQGRLKNAAADLLAACKASESEFYELLHSSTSEAEFNSLSIVVILRAAIAKAEGR